MSRAPTLSLEGELTIYRAAELKPLLLQLPPEGAALTLDLSAVSEIDTAGVQLLLLSQREARLVSRGWALVAISPCVREALTLLGLQALLPVTTEEALA